jgi:hypothetical protein
LCQERISLLDLRWWYTLEGVLPLEGLCARARAGVCGDGGPDLSAKSEEFHPVGNVRTARCLPIELFLQAMHMFSQVLCLALTKKLGARLFALDVQDAPHQLLDFSAYRG